MGVVFFGRSAGGRPVAVKVIRPEYAGDRQFRERFAREIEAARRVGGFHTAPVVDADPAADPPWMVTAYVAGPSLHHAVAENGPLEADALRALGAGLAEGLGAIHACGLVHRDLKPGNVLLADDGPRIIDFGIARATDASVMMTTAGAILGTYLFMSPEQMHGRPAGPPSDVFSLGGVLAFAAGGASPFDGESLPAVIHGITSGEPDLSRVPTGSGLRELIGACLSKDPAGRPSVAELLRRLGDGGPGEGWPPATVLDMPSAPDPSTAPVGGFGPAQEAFRGGTAGGPELHQQPTAAAPPRRAARPGPPGDPSRPGDLGSPVDPSSAARSGSPAVSGSAHPPTRQRARSGSPAGAVPGSPRRRVFLTLGAVTVAAAVGVPLALKATGGHDGNLLPDGGDFVEDVAFSPNGKILAGVGLKSVRIWDPATWSSLGGFPVTGLSSKRALALSRDGRIVAAGTDHGTVHVWDTATKRSAGVLQGKDSSSVKSVAIDAEGRTVYANDAGAVWIWALPGGQAPGVLRPAGTTGTLNCLALAPDGKTLAVATSFDANVVLMSTATRRVITVIHAQTDVSELAFSPDGTILAGMAGEDVQLWGMPKAGRNQVIGSLRNQGSLAVSFAFGSGGRTLAVVYDDHEIRLWSVSTRRTTKTISLPEDDGATTGGVAFSPDGASLVVARSGSADLRKLR